MPGIGETRFRHDVLYEYDDVLSLVLMIHVKINITIFNVLTFKCKSFTV